MAIHVGVPVGQTLIVSGVPAPSVRWHVGPVMHKGSGMPIEVDLTTEQQVKLSITPLTPAGNPAQLDGPAQWTVAGTCSVQVIDDVSAWIKAGVSPGDSVVTVAADADLGTGVVPLADTCTVHVANPMAANLGLEAEEPVLKP